MKAFCFGNQTCYANRDRKLTCNHLWPLAAQSITQLESLYNHSGCKHQEEHWQHYQCNSSYNPGSCYAHPWRLRQCFRCSHSRDSQQEWCSRQQACLQVQEASGINSSSLANHYIPRLALADSVMNAQVVCLWFPISTTALFIGCPLSILGKSASSALSCSLPPVWLPSAAAPLFNFHSCKQ